MKIKTFEIGMVGNILTKLTNERLPFGISLELAELLLIVESKTSWYQSERMKILNDYLKKDDDGNFIQVLDENKKGTGTWEVLEGREKELEVAIEELNKTEISLDFNPINLSEKVKDGEKEITLEEKLSTIEIEPLTLAQAMKLGIIIK